MKQNLYKDNRMTSSIYNLVREKSDPNEYPYYIFALLFLKYISDIHLDVLSTKDSNSQKKTNGKQKDFLLSFSIPTVEFSLLTDSSNKLPVNFYTLYENKDAQNLDELCHFVFQTIEKHNDKLLAGLFQDLDFSFDSFDETIFKESEQRNSFLKELLEILYQQELQPSIVDATVVRQSFIRLIKLFGSARGFGRAEQKDFFTPTQLSRLMVQLVKPKSGDTVCDPVCGVGGFLTQAAEFVTNKKIKLFGQEIHQTAWKLARMNMLLHNIDDAQLEWGDTLGNPLLLQKDKRTKKNKLMQFDVVLASPPFVDRNQTRDDREKMEADVYNRFWRGVPLRYQSEWLFISHALETALKKQGRVAVLATHGVLFRHGQEKIIRQKIIEENQLDAVIGLPRKLLLQAGIPLVILLFDRSREKGGAREHCKDILFIDASNEFIANRRQNVLSNNHIEKIVQAYNNRKREKSFANLVKLKTIKENNFDLNIQSYVNSFEEKTMDLKALEKEIQTLGDELKNVQEALAEKIKVP